MTEHINLLYRYICTEMCKMYYVEYIEPILFQFELLIIFREIQDGSQCNIQREKMNKQRSVFDFSNSSILATSLEMNFLTNWQFLLGHFCKISKEFDNFLITIFYFSSLSFTFFTVFGKDTCSQFEFMLLLPMLWYYQKIIIYFLR